MSLKETGRKANAALTVLNLTAAVLVGGLVGFGTQNICLGLASSILTWTLMEIRSALMMMALLIKSLER
jgi:hypothetical protein